MALGVVAIAILAIFRYYKLASEHSEARHGFELLLLLSIGTLAVFIAGVMAIYLKEEGEEGGNQASYEQ